MEHLYELDDSYDVWIDILEEKLRHKSHWIDQKETFGYQMKGKGGYGYVV